MYRKTEESGLTEIIPFMYPSYLVVTTLCFSHPEFLRAHHREWLQPEGNQITFFSFLSALKAQEFTSGRLELLITVISLLY